MDRTCIGEALRRCELRSVAAGVHVVCNVLNTADTDILETVRAARSFPFCTAKKCIFPTV